MDLTERAEELRKKIAHSLGNIWTIRVETVLVKIQRILYDKLSLNSLVLLKLSPTSVPASSMLVRISSSRLRLDLVVNHVFVVIC